MASRIPNWLLNEEMLAFGNVSFLTRAVPSRQPHDSYQSIMFKLICVLSTKNNKCYLHKIKYLGMNFFIGDYLQRELFDREYISASKQFSLKKSALA